MHWWQVGFCVDREVSGCGGFGLVICIVYIAANRIRIAVWVTTPKAIVSPLCLCVCVHQFRPSFSSPAAGAGEWETTSILIPVVVLNSLATLAGDGEEDPWITEHTHNSTQELLENTMSLVTNVVAFHTLFDSDIYTITMAQGHTSQHHSFLLDRAIPWPKAWLTLITNSQSKEQNNDSHCMYWMQAQAHYWCARALSSITELSE